MIRGEKETYGNGRSTSQFGLGVLNLGRVSSISFELIKCGLSVAANPLKSRLDLISRPLLVVGCVDAKLPIGQCRLGCTEPVI